MASKQIANISLQRDLSRWLLLVMLLFSLPAGLITGLIAFYEAEDIQDDILFQVSTLLNADSLPSRQALFHSNPDALIIIQNLSLPEGGPLNIKRTLKDGLHSIEDNGIPWRLLVVTLKGSNGSTVRYALAQQTELRDEMAFANSASAVIPIIILAISLVLMTRWVISHRIKPIKQLASEIDKRDDNDLTPLSMKYLPAEIIPFGLAINRLLKRTEESIVRQQRFIADAAHELRTPVTALSLLTENLKKTDSDEEYNKRYLLLKKGLDRLKLLVEQLLNLARLQSDHFSNPRKVSLNQIVQNILVDTYPLAEAKEIDIGIVKQDRIKLKDRDNGLYQVVLNAVSNAIHYTPGNGRIDISLYIDNNIAFFLVEDTGPGVNEDELQKVLEPFYRVEGNSEPGNGLGLTICVEVANRLGGKIILKNRSEGGLAFKYSQPL
ncbi:ATP-binding protein [Spartinivicinus poritis]|uniref:histidine kinase n=1 Tax=Spartinivicinus poritis TaxID=2994640 RepID=A0ABT5UB68_9GAMM|nr:ATP-binding protein [Spartinivicinus sp. A2-2]MDE1463624.1 ATP-binding protein [Spartinivicinus sp. A2-2]